MRMAKGLRPFNQEAGAGQLSQCKLSVSVSVSVTCPFAANHAWAWPNLWAAENQFRMYVGYTLLYFRGGDGGSRSQIRRLLEGWNDMLLADFQYFRTIVKHRWFCFVFCFLFFTKLGL